MILQKIRLQTNHFLPLHHFYKNILALAVTFDNDDHFTIDAGHSKLIFEKSAYPQIDPLYHFAFNIPSNKIQEAHDWLKERTKLLWIDDYNSYITDFRAWHARSVYFLDPGGNIVEFIARDDLKDIINEPFSSTHIRNISEIGFVFPEQGFKQSVEQLLKDCQLDYFSKQPPQESFCAIGDDEGLLIIVPENRSWYPCKDKPAGMFPIEITFSDQNVVRTIGLS